MASKFVCLFIFFCGGLVCCGFGHELATRGVSGMNSPFNQPAR